MKRNLLQCMARVLLLPVALMFICGALVSAHAEYSGPKVRFRLAHPCPPGHHTSLAFENHERRHHPSQVRAGADRHFEPAGQRAFEHDDIAPQNGIGENMHLDLVL